MTHKILDGKIALVTGASRGIGFEIAKEYARQGAQIIATARTTGGLEALDDAIKSDGGLPPVLITADFNDIGSLEALGPTISTRFDHIDIFVANAGILGTMGPLAHCKMGEAQKVMNINVMANIQLIRTLNPLLLNSDAGRVIFITSGAAHGPRAYWGTYAISKAATEQLANVYAAENNETNINVNSVDPGKVRTNMRAEAYPGENPETLPHPADITQIFVNLAQESCTTNGQIFDVIIKKKAA